jgi:hypothetical protein
MSGLLLPFWRQYSLFHCSSLLQRFAGQPDFMRTVAEQADFIPVNRMSRRDVGFVIVYTTYVNCKFKTSLFSYRNSVNERDLDLLNSLANSSGFVQHFLEGLSVCSRWKFEAITGL